MFKRVIVEEWVFYLPIAAFFIFAAVFAVITIRAVRLGKPERERMASLPLEDSSENPQS